MRVDVSAWGGMIDRMDGIEAELVQLRAAVQWAKDRFARQGDQVGAWHMGLAAAFKGTPKDVQNAYEARPAASMGAAGAEHSAEHCDDPTCRLHW